MVKCTSLCGLGQSAPNPVLTTLRYFHHEYDELLVQDNGAGDAGIAQDAKETVP